MVHDGARGSFSGNLEIRLARDEAEIDAAQALRYKIFFDERGAKPSPQAEESKRDIDAFDPYCDHLLVFDHAKGEGTDAIVATYRLMRNEAAKKAGKFYTSDEYDISALLKRDENLLELGRSCVDADHRNSSTMQLLWGGIAAYVFHFDIGIMFGCASFLGTDPRDYAAELSYLYHNHLAPEDMRPVALPEVYTDMRLMDPDAIDQRRTLAKLPPLVKGYLRLGGFIGDGAFVDHQFNTTDVAVVVKTDLVSEKYYKHYDRTVRG